MAELLAKLQYVLILFTLNSPTPLSHPTHTDLSRPSRAQRCDQFSLHLFLIVPSHTSRARLLLTACQTTTRSQWPPALVLRRPRGHRQQH